MGRGAWIGIRRRPGPLLPGAAPAQAAAPPPPAGPPPPARPLARSLPGLGEHSIHSAAGRGRSRSQSQSRAGPGSRRRRRGDAGERGRAGGRASRGPGRPTTRAARPSGLWAERGRPAGRGSRGAGRRGRGGGAGPPVRPPAPGPGGAAPQAPERPAPCSPGLAGGPAPRLGASGASCPPTVRWWGPCPGRACGIFPLLPSLSARPGHPGCPGLLLLGHLRPLPRSLPSLLLDTVPPACGWLLSQQLVRRPRRERFRAGRPARGAAVPPRAPLPGRGPPAPPGGSGMRRLCHLVLGYASSGGSWAVVETGTKGWRPAAAWLGGFLVPRGRWRGGAAGKAATAWGGGGGS